MKIAARKKVFSENHRRIEHEGMVWHVDCAVWHDRVTGKGEFRVYRVHGDITSPLLAEALEIQAAAFCLGLTVHREQA